ncbi:MAG: CoA transferase [Acidobacteria bacterium]|nr:CoA transferase [Acidobacteriota bacterium]
MNTAPPGSGWAPLKDMRVLDFSAQLPGPMTTSILADLGATVIKVEPPGGEFGRRLPGGLFDRVNRGKRSIVVDLKAAAAQKITTRLASWADVVIETFRPGVADRLGIGPDALRLINPKIVYCSLSGFGQTGPWRDLPGHDLSYLAASGAMGLSGEWKQPPHRSSLLIGDLAGGSFAVSAILAAMIERGKTGVGCYIDMSLFESALYCVGTRTAFNEENGPRDHLFPTQGLFETSDGVLIATAIVEQHFWKQFLAGAGDLDPELRSRQFDTPADRFQAGDALYERLQRLFAGRTASDWEAIFRGSGLPVEICLSPQQAGRTDHVESRGVLIERGGRKYCPFPVTVDGGRRPGRRATPAPNAGEDGFAILKELGFQQGELEEFVESGVVAPPETGDASLRKEG